MDSAKLRLNGQEFEFPTLVGSEGEIAVDFTTLRAKTKAVAFDPAYGNTGSCKSAITFIDGEKGILRYRGYDIEGICAKSSFAAAAYLLINGNFPNEEELKEWRGQLVRNMLVHEHISDILDHFPHTAHPMAVLSAMIGSMSSFYPDSEKTEDHSLNILRLMGQLPTIAAYTYKKRLGEPVIYPRTDLSYCGNFLRMMFGSRLEEYMPHPSIEDALNLLLILHADHEQNCSTSTVRMVGSSQANIFASMSAGICALWGPLHGGANQAVIEMLEAIREDGGNYKKYVDMAKDKESGFKLMGFGHRVYKNFDPRARVLAKAAENVLDVLGIDDPLLEIARNLEQVALKDEFFVERNLYPNVDFYSGIIYRALGIPTDMFTIMFAMGRLPGWIAHWLEMRNEPGARINRPRQIYTGENLKPFDGVVER